MATNFRGLWVACLLVSSTATAWAQAPSPAQILNFKPRMDNVPCAHPTAEEQKSCSVEPLKNAKGATVGWFLIDHNKQPLRRFVDTNNNNKIDVWSYYKDGHEVYREVDTNANERPDQFRWYNEAGMRWGVDSTESGRIDTWRMISAEEVGQEAFQALLTRDFERLRALFITEAEMRALKLPVAKVEGIKAKQAAAAAKFKATLEKANLGAGAHFIRVEGAAPQCVPAESTGMDSDLLHFANRQIFYESGDKRHDWIHTGEMIQVGLTWRLVDAPSTQLDPMTVSGGGNAVPKELETLLETLSKIDNEGPPIVFVKERKEVERLQRRIKLIEKILPLVAGEDRENFFRQMVDNLATAAPLDPECVTRLVDIRQHLEKTLPGSTMAAYTTFREISARYQPQIAKTTKPEDMTKIQEKLQEELAKFVASYPSGEDTADALYQLALGCEFAGKDEQAKRWYKQLYTNFSDSSMAAKAKGSERRLSLVGQELDLKGPTLSGQAFDVGQHKGKVVAVLYWASYVQSSPRDFAILKQLQTAYAAKGFEIVTVNLDDSQEDASKFLQANTLSCVHLYQQAKTGGGLNSPYAVQFGINGLPTLFLVGRDGKVVSRNLQVIDLEDALKRSL